jgi:hypothetical protein
VTGEVVNPDHVELERLLVAVRSLQGSTSGVLRVPDRLMGSGGAWTGPGAASAFTGDVGGRHGRLPWHFQELVDAVVHKLSRVPSTVPRAG